MLRRPVCGFIAGEIMPCLIRLARDSDAPGVSRVILAALLSSNAQDYPPSVIARVQQSFTPEGVAELMKKRQMFVALIGGVPVGTASLDGRAVRSVFVDPQMHKRGIGRHLMWVVERAAREAGVTVLAVPSSLTAQAFYARLGYQVVREIDEGGERTIVMERELSPAQ